MYLTFNRKIDNLINHFIEDDQESIDTKFSFQIQIELKVTYASKSKNAGS